MVQQDADGNLYPRVGIEIERREISQNDPAHRELTHEIIDHDAGSNSLEETMKKEGSGKNPGDPRPRASAFKLSVRLLGGRGTHDADDLPFSPSTNESSPAVFVARRATTIEASTTAPPAA